MIAILRSNGSVGTYFRRPSLLNHLRCDAFRRRFSGSSSIDDVLLGNQESIEHLASSVSPRVLDLVQTAFRQQREEIQASPSTSEMEEGRVFSNRELDMDKMDAIGFDYDYTLASYKTALQHFIYDEAKKHLVEKGGYPEQLLRLVFEKDFAVRGLTFDRRTGMFLKLSFFQRVTIGRAFLGRRRVSHDELIQAYGANLHMSRHYMDTHCVWVNDLFSLSEACLLSDCIQLALDESIDFDPFALQQDVQSSISHVHTTGTMRRAVQSNPENFLHANPQLKPLLSRWRDAGKQLFLLTNSSFPFVNAGMSYIVNDPNWRDLFDIVITAAGKPRFFTEDKPFRCLNQREDSSFAMWHPVTEKDMNRVLVGGSVERLSQLAGWENLNALYFGDHLHSDLVEPRQRRGWYTGAIIRELEKEFQVQRQDEYKLNLTTIFRLEALLKDVQFHVGVDHVNHEALKKLLDALETARMEIYAQTGDLFNKHFGSIFRSLGDPSAYALSLFRGCDIYTTRIENFSHYLPSHRFYPSHTDHLPHEKLYRSNYK